MDAVLVGELQQGAGPHRPGEVQVQMGFRQQADVSNVRGVVGVST
jgi:hypothetical protein